MSRLSGVKISAAENKRMEDESRRMEAKLDMLRGLMSSSEAERAKKSSGSAAGASRWKSGSDKKPLKHGYVDKVMKDVPVAKPRPKQAASSDRPTSRESRSSASELPPDTSEPLTSLCAAEPVQHAQSSRAGSNMAAALARNNTDEAEVKSFLSSLGLDRYIGIFVDNGFDCMDVVEEMEESHMKDLGMAAGHVIKLTKKLNEKRQANAPAKPESGTARRVSFGATEEKPLEKAPSSPGGGYGTGGGSLWGVFDEEEASRGFKDAVAAWRGERNQAPATSPKGSSSLLNAQPSGPVGSFWSSIPTDENSSDGVAMFNLERASTPVHPDEAASLSGTREGSASTNDGLTVEEKGSKLCCYQCYRQFFEKFKVERADPIMPGRPKNFCSEDCAKTWEEAAAKKAEELQKRHAQAEKLEEKAQILAEERKKLEAQKAENDAREAQQASES
eukprot:gnl/MRDRNA2_/MRDRNA2_99719_c0_seq1.p1 gnl/MRDRNA2_/MRDRNA2_99719_c0~~gnl/MRDRNA2_/MRDRNA2_99719_c0_seq1.p1  ORF type:complete len:447 (+),score=104.43 gnl/MRDRNA2_/MRDRNA2_99719_c0_seq1:82-1422(+)